MHLSSGFGKLWHSQKSSVASDREAALHHEAAEFESLLHTVFGDRDFTKDEAYRAYCKSKGLDVLRSNRLHVDKLFTDLRGCFLEIGDTLSFVPRRNQ